MNKKVHVHVFERAMQLMAAKLANRISALFECRTAGAAAAQGRQRQGGLALV